MTGWDRHGGVAIAVNTRRRFLLGAGGVLLDLALSPAAAIGQSTRRPAYKIGPWVDHRMTRGTFCVVMPGEALSRGRVAPGDIVQFVRSPGPGVSGAIFLYAPPPPGGYRYSKSDDKLVGRDNEHYACVVDRCYLRVIEYGK